MVDAFIPGLQTDSLHVEVHLRVCMHMCCCCFFLFLCAYPHDFQGQQRQQSAITPPVSSMGVWRLAALSVIVCLDVSLCPTHTITQRGSCSWWQAASLSLLPACLTESFLSNSYLHWFLPLPPNLDTRSLRTGQLQSLGPEKEGSSQLGWWVQSINATAFSCPNFFRVISSAVLGLSAAE